LYNFSRRCGWRSAPLPSLRCCRPLPRGSFEPRTLCLSRRWPDSRHAADRGLVEYTAAAAALDATSCSTADVVCLRCHICPPAGAGGGTYCCQVSVAAGHPKGEAPYSCMLGCACNADVAHCTAPLVILLNLSAGACGGAHHCPQIGNLRCCRPSSYPMFSHE
jgi:hypothetical protein